MGRATILLVRLRLWTRLVMILKGLIVLLNLLTNQALWLLERNNLNLFLRRFKLKTMELLLLGRMMMGTSRAWTMLT
jgi:hypothetical protein